VTDIFREVDEEVRRERLKRIWQKYQTLILGTVALVIFGAGGWRYYEFQETRRASEVGSYFDNAALLAEAGRHEEAERAFAQVVRVGTSGYRDLARLRLAAEIAHRDAAAAIISYRQIADDPSAEQALRDLATVRAAALQIDAGSYEEARKFLEPLAVAGKDFRHTARELIALAAWKTGDAAAIKKWFVTIVADRETPPPVRSRVEVLLTLSIDEPKS
jgi:hypothetical protein